MSERSKNKHPGITPVTLKSEKIKYVVQISKFNKTLYIGRFDKLSEAKRERDLAKAN